MTVALEAPPAETPSMPAPPYAPGGRTAQPLRPAPDAEEMRLGEKAVLLRLTITAWGVNRMLKEHQYEVDANKALTRAGKKVLVSKELQAVYALDNGCRDWVASRSLPSQFKKGLYLQPVANLLEVDDYLLAYAALRKGLVEEFLCAYPRQAEAMREELRGLFNPRNYPNAEKLRKRFGVSYEYLELAGAPTVLQRVSAERFAREQEKVRARWEEALEEARALLRAQMASLVSHLSERLEPGADGKPKVFRDSLVSNMEEWLECFGARNLASDAELSALVERARALLRPQDGPAVTAGALRSDAGLRDHLQRQFERIREQADLLVADRPARRIRLEE